MSLNISASEREDAVVLIVQGDLTDESKKLLDVVQEQLQAGHKNLVLDVSQVHFTNSSGLGILITAYTKVRNNGGRIVLAGLGQRLRDQLQITKLYTVYDTYDSVDAGLAALQSRKPA